MIVNQASRFNSLKLLEFFAAVKELQIFHGSNRIGEGTRLGMLRNGE
jgi:hypothetical protein